MVPKQVTTNTQTPQTSATRVCPPGSNLGPAERHRSFFSTSYSVEFLVVSPFRIACSFLRMLGPEAKAHTGYSGGPRSNSITTHFVAAAARSVACCAFWPSSMEPNHRHLQSCMGVAMQADVGVMSWLSCPRAPSASLTLWFRILHRRLKRASFVV
jgi:hypothetical protein